MQSRIARPGGGPGRAKLPWPARRRRAPAPAVTWWRVTWLGRGRRDLPRLRHAVAAATHRRDSRMGDGHGSHGLLERRVAGTHRDTTRGDS